jgi:hypothetical protein
MAFRDRVVPLLIKFVKNVPTVDHNETNVDAIDNRTFLAMMSMECLFLLTKDPKFKLPVISLGKHFFLYFFFRFSCSRGGNLKPGFFFSGC